MDSSTLVASGRRWLAPVLCVVLAISLALTGFWAYSLNRDLEEAQSELAAARETIAGQSEQLAALRSDIDREVARGDELSADVAGLEARVANQDACIAALEIDASILNDVADMQIELNNLTAIGSVWAAASDEYDALTGTALDAYYEAYSVAFDGNYAAANEWIASGNVAIASSNAAVDTMNVEIDKANALIEESDALLGEYAANDISMCLPSTDASL